MQGKMMFKQLRLNPLVVHNTRHAKRPASITLLGTALLLAVAVTITLVAYGSEVQVGRVGEHNLIPLGWPTVVVLIYALGLATLAATFAGLETRSQRYQLVLLSTLPGTAIVAGLLVTLIYKLRVVLLTIIMITPLLVWVRHPQLFAANDRFYALPLTSYPLMLSRAFRQAWPGHLFIVTEILRSLTTIMLFYGMTVLALSAGLAAGLTQRHRPLAVALCEGIVLAGGGLWAVVRTAYRHLILAPMLDIQRISLPSTARFVRISEAEAMRAIVLPHVAGLLLATALIPIAMLILRSARRTVRLGR